MWTLVNTSYGVAMGQRPGRPGNPTCYACVPAHGVGGDPGQCRNGEDRSLRIHAGGWRCLTIVLPGRSLMLARRRWGCRQDDRPRLRSLPPAAIPRGHPRHTPRVARLATPSPGRRSMAHVQPPLHPAHDRLLVLGVAAVVLGLLLVGHGVLLAEPATHRVSRAHPMLIAAERIGPAHEERLTTDTPPTNHVPPTSTPRTASSGVTGLLGSCPLPFDLDHDRGQDLAAMAQQGRRIFQEHQAGHCGAPANQDGLAKYRELAGAEGSVAHAAASPPAAPLSAVPSC